MIGHLIIIKSWFFSPPKSLKRLHAARIGQLADSNEPAKMQTQTLRVNGPSCVNNAWFYVTVTQIAGKAPTKYCFSDWTHIGDVITFCLLVLRCLHQFSCNSHQKQGSPTTIMGSSPSFWHGKRKWLDTVQLKSNAQAKKQDYLASNWQHLQDCYSFTLCN